MKKRLFTLACAARLLLSFTLTAHAATLPEYSYYYATLKQRLSSRSGPGTRYDEDALTINSISDGTTLRVLSRSYDSANDRWWMQVEITYQGTLYRVYTGEQRFYSLNMSAVPTEYQLGTCRVAYAISDAYWGPGTGYRRAKTVPAGTSCAIWGYEENAYEDRDYIQIEYYDSGSRCYRRCWVPEWAVDDEYMYYGWP